MTAAKGTFFLGIILGLRSYAHAHNDMRDGPAHKHVS